MRVSAVAPVPKAQALNLHLLASPALLFLVTEHWSFSRLSLVGTGRNFLVSDRIGNRFP